jgi:hypothetical protein
VPEVEIRVKGRIDKQWSDWLGGLTVAHTDQDETVLSGALVDQPALYGVLTKLRDLGLSLLSVKCEGTDDWEPGSEGEIPALETGRDPRVGQPD